MPKGTITIVFRYTYKKSEFVELVAKGKTDKFLFLELDNFRFVEIIRCKGL